MGTSLIITTYNSPKYLDWSLASVAWQVLRPVQVIVADDGSRPETQRVVEKWRPVLTCPLIHSFQPDDGFRLARSRNLASQKAIGEWVVFVDGDCVMPSNFLSNLSQLFEGSGLVFGSRKLLSSIETEKLLSSAPDYGLVESMFSGRKFFEVPLGFLRTFPARSWRNVRGFLMALRRDDLSVIGGFDENYRGWGLEDSEFAIRAKRSGLTLIDSRYKTSLVHLHHPEPPGDVKSDNQDMFMRLIKDEACLVSPRSCFGGELGDPA
jgi:glycosyltransferase involved in cell wall biosynthesis